MTTTTATATSIEKVEYFHDDEANGENENENETELENEIENEIENGDEASLHYNLIKCSQALSKIREFHKQAPALISGQLCLMEDVLSSCLCCMVTTENRKRSSKNSSTLGSGRNGIKRRQYWYVLENLMEISTNQQRFALRLYFCKSPFWEHYDRNVTEIIALLDKILHGGDGGGKKEKGGAGPKASSSRRSRSISTSSYGNSKSRSNNKKQSTASTTDSVEERRVIAEVEKFRRKFVPFAKIVLERHWR